MSPRICLDLYMSRIRLKSKIGRRVKYVLLQTICMFRNYQSIEMVEQSNVYIIFLNDFAEALILAKSLLY